MKGNVKKIVTLVALVLVVALAAVMIIKRLGPQSAPSGTPNPGTEQTAAPVGSGTMPSATEDPNATPDPEASAAPSGSPAPGAATPVPGVTGTDVQKWPSAVSGTDMVVPFIYPASGTDITSTLPIELGQGLSVTHIGYYNGSFTDDGSMEVVYGILSVVVKNTTANALKAADFTVTIDGTAYGFTAEAVPAGGSAVLVEKNRGEYMGSVSGASFALGSAEFYGSEVCSDLTFEITNGSIKVTNGGGKISGDVTVFYKVLGGDGIPVGSTAYSGVIKGGVKAGEEKSITVDGIGPENYIVVLAIAG